MNYHIKLSSLAERTFLSFARPRRVFVGEHLLLLADDPFAVSRISTFPYPAGYRQYEFDEPESGYDSCYYHFSVLFNARNDPRIIEVAAIGYSPMTFDPGWNPPNH
jgi:hypothetical protein